MANASRSSILQRTQIADTVCAFLNCSTFFGKSLYHRIFPTLSRVFRQLSSVNKNMNSYRLPLLAPLLLFAASAHCAGLAPPLSEWAAGVSKDAAFRESADGAAVLGVRAGGEESA